MKGFVPVVMLTVVLGSALAGMDGQRYAGQGQVYSVAELRAALARSPGAWTRHPLLVRGVATAAGCVLPAPSGALCGPPRFILSDPDPAAAADRLDLAWAGSDHLLSVLRRVPLARSLVPAPQEIHWDVVAVYRVQLGIERECSTACYEALLLDAQP